MSSTTLQFPDTTAPLVKGALERELNLLKVNIENTERKVQDADVLHGREASELYRMFLQGEMGDSRGIMIWVSEYEALVELRKEYRELEAVLSSWVQ